MLSLDLMAAMTPLEDDVTSICEVPLLLSAIFDDDVMFISLLQKITHCKEGILIHQALTSNFIKLK